MIVDYVIYSEYTHIKYFWIFAVKIKNVQKITSKRSIDRKLRIESTIYESTKDRPTLFSEILHATSWKDLANDGTFVSTCMDKTPEYKVSW